MAYGTYPAVDNTTKAFPPEVRQAIADAAELLNKYAHLSTAGELVIGSTPVPVTPSPVAGLNTVGWAKAVFIPAGGTIPVGTPPYTIVVESA